MPQVIIAVVITLIITAVAVWFISTEYHKKVANTKIGNAEEQARGIIDEAVKSEDKKREAMLEIKEETIRSKNEIDKEIKERRNEIQRNERRIVQKEENLDKELEAIEKREASFPCQRRRFEEAES